MSRKEELIEKIERKEQQILSAERECGAWNRGKHKTHSNAPISQIFMKSLYKEIENLKKQLSEFE